MPKGKTKPYYKSRSVSPSFLDLSSFALAPYVSTHVGTTLHLVRWFQMRLPDFFLIGPSGQLWNSIESKYSVLVLYCSFLIVLIRETLTHVVQMDGNDEWQVLGQSPCTSLS